ncbi:MAG: hypothetical protein JXA18_00920, partial [Chitinispirillaceae bacterium]|nr:hypothetical protein [Chitinispirillaceae bacterium]
PKSDNNSRFSDFFWRFRSVKAVFILKVAVVKTNPLEIDNCIYLFIYMFLRHLNKKSGGKDHCYWALCESYRTEKGVRQRIVGYIGDITRKQAKAMALAAERCDSYQTNFLSPEELPDKLEIEPKKTRTERQREFGGVWLGNKLFGKVGLDDFFRQRGAGQWLTIFKILTISRFYHPSSELHIAEHLYEHSAMEKVVETTAKSHSIINLTSLSVELGLESEDICLHNDQCVQILFPALWLSGIRRGATQLDVHRITRLSFVSIDTSTLG